MSRAKKIVQQQPRRKKLELSNDVSYNSETSTGISNMVNHEPICPLWFNVIPNGTISKMKLRSSIWWLNDLKSYKALKFSAPALATTAQPSGH